jgi:hypothetical protein
MVEHLIYFSLIEIQQPLNLILETPAGNYSKPDDFEYDEEGYNSVRSAFESEDKEANNDINE